MRLKGKSAIVTGAGRGIGRDIARRFAVEGARVVIADIEKSHADAAAAEINDGIGSAHALTADVADPDQVARLFAEAGEYFAAPLDVLVNNAGIAHHGAFLELTLEDWHRVMSNNLTSVFLCGQAGARLMAPRRQGSIINIGSISAQRGSFGRTAYGIAKAGIHQMTRIMAVELGAMGVNVNAIAPGPIDTGMTSFGPDQKRRYLERIPANRFGLAGDISGVAVFLASADAAYMNGAVVNVDGGFDAAGLIFSYEELTTVTSDARDESVSE
ncbi:MAG: 3-oxoacyl-ACP reductase family protein [Alphaproteobacteria bacterium]|jgi:3-oxoacyl-[acyl-carrier protein] reductase|nr:3-oxoacyl-ACP reductase family protein [Alphaproteobacteria bacterium]